ncbi:zinc finger protein 800 [Colletes gigas]|uniref:zinc finger protein 800 n=1 Tax=Colletes gigas TaxID=935657 RepID=UPI001C9A7260|nr:zinc finger protein 800 [Colletes gigas]
MKSMKAKAKAKKHNGKFGRVKFPSKEAAPTNPDLSHLRPPIDTSVSSLYRVSKVLETGSDEVRSILAYECDLIYECRICRSLFRSLVNFVSHKRIYCKEKFDVTFYRNSSTNHDAILTSKLDVQRPEKISQESSENNRILRSQVPKEEQKKDLTSVINMLQKKQTESFHSHVQQPCFETVQSNPSAVYQTVESVVQTPNHVDLMKTQAMELKNMISGQTAVLGPDGQVLQSTQEKNNSNEDSGQICETELNCSTCGAKFSTRKTLAVHTRTLHTSRRLCYPCPCCSSTFANTWSVYRHLFKVHRKSNEQVRKFRSQIQEKAFIKDTTAAEDLERQQANKNLLSRAPLRINETQEWMNHLESDTALQRCGGCGKRFDRKAALSAHSQYCHQRVAANGNISKIRKTNKVSPDCISSNVVVALESSEICNSNETPIRVEAVASLSKVDWDMLENGKPISQDKVSENVTVPTTNEDKIEADEQNHFSTNNASNSLEIVYTNINTRKTNVGSKKRKNKDSAKRLITNIDNGTRVMPGKVTVEKETETEKVDHVLAMEMKVASIVNLQKLQCLLCKQKFPSVNNLRRHAAIHIGWNRYQCKLCSFKCFVKCDCVAHCNKEHNAQNNRVIIEEMISQIPDDKYTSEQDITLDITNLEEQFRTPEVVEISISPGHKDPEIHVQSNATHETDTGIVNETGTKADDETEARVANETEANVVDETEKKAEEKVADETEGKAADVTEEEAVDENLAAFQETVDATEGIEESLSNGIKSQNTSGLDPELRKMVMEVIFGSSEVSSTKEVETNESVSSEQSQVKLQNKGDGEMQSKDSDSKEKDIASLHDSSKPQRPIRNKIKPLNKDFIYDLKEVTFRKDVALRKDGLIVKPFNKPLVKKSLIREEDNLDDDEQLPKRFKSLENNEVSILCDNSAIDKYEMKFNRGGLKSNHTFSQCHG